MERQHRFGDLLRDFRLRAALTQEELASKSGISARTISLLETGKRNAPRLASVRLLAAGLGLSQVDGGALLSATTAVPDRRSRIGGPFGPPACLPPDIPDFVGRESELGKMRSANGIVVISGMAGIGKSTLAVRAARGVASRFPDGQFFCNLYGFTADRAPLAPKLALLQLLLLAGVPADRIGSSLEERVGLWRTVTANRRVLLVLDDTADDRQIRPLLPGASGSLTVVTSRPRLPGLAGALPVPLDVLPPASATELFGRIGGEDRPAEPEIAAEIVALCGYLPLAIRIAALRVSRGPARTAGELLLRLRDSDRRLGELRTNGLPDLGAAFSQSYRPLDTAELTLLARLAARSNRVFTAELAAELTGLGPHRTECALEKLLDHHLLLQPAPGYYALHSLLHQHARGIAGARLTRIGQPWLDPDRAITA